MICRFIRKDDLILCERCGVPINLPPTIRMESVSRGCSAPADLLPVEEEPCCEPPPGVEQEEWEKKQARKRTG